MSGLATGATVADAFDEAAARWRDRPFLHILDETAAAYGINAGPLTYGEAGAAIPAIRARYRAAGWGARDRVGLMLDNRPSFFLHWLALNGLGVSVVPLSAALRPAELDYLVTDSAIGLAIAAELYRSILMEAAARTGRPFVVARDSDHEIAGRTLPPARATAQAGATAECAVLYTSGTTGRPKGCVLSNAYFWQCGHWYNEIGGLARIAPGAERLLTPLPMVHMNAMACSTMAMMMTGGCIIPLDRFHPSSWWRSVRESGATIVHYLGIMPSLLIAAPPSPDDRDHRIRFGFGAGVDRRHHAAFETRFGFPLLEAWAMTETGAGAAIIAAHEPRHVGTQCFGRAPASIEVRILGEDGAPVGAETPGELLVRAAGDDPRAGFFTEYLGDPKATAAAWQDGWFHTGDIVRRAADGYLYFVDRQKNLVRRSGENISAVEVETVLRRHALVREVAVAPTPDELRGEEVLACVVPRDPMPPAAMDDAARAIVAAALEELSYFKVPGWVAFVDELPLTATQKVQRNELKSLARALPGTARCIDTRALKRRPERGSGHDASG